jgi:hypothetical protein
MRQNRGLSLPARGEIPRNSTPIHTGIRSADLFWKIV